MNWPPWTTAFLASMRQVPDRTLAAKQAGVDRSTTQRLGQRDPLFEAATNAARDEALDRMERLIYQRATTGQPVRKTITKTLPDGRTETIVTEESHVSDNLAMFYLKRWRVEYRDSVKVEQTGPGGGPIQIEIEEKLNEAAGRFDAEVVRLADARAARDAAGSAGG